MNELFILDELMEGPQNGYHLRSSLQVSLGHHRKISYGVIYPLLDKLTQQGMITMTETVENGRSTKIATITEAGKVRFFDLMRTLKTDGAHGEDIMLIKLDAMQHFALPEQLAFLEQFVENQHQIIADAEGDLTRLDNKLTKDHWYAAQKVELRIHQANAALDWAAEFKDKLTKGDHLYDYDERN